MPPELSTLMAYRGQGTCMGREPIYIPAKDPADEPDDEDLDKDEKHAKKVFNQDIKSENACRKLCLQNFKCAYVVYEIFGSLAALETICGIVFSSCHVGEDRSAPLSLDPAVVSNIFSPVSWSTCVDDTSRPRHGREKTVSRDDVARSLIDLGHPRRDESSRLGPRHWPRSIRLRATSSDRCKFQVNRENVQTRPRQVQGQMRGRSGAPRREAEGHVSDVQ